MAMQHGGAGGGGPNSRLRARPLPLRKCCGNLKHPYLPCFAAKALQSQSGKLGPKNMKCPHCGINFHKNWLTGSVNRGTRRKYGGDEEPNETGWRYRTGICPECKELTIELAPPLRSGLHEDHRQWRQVHPIGSNRGPVPPEVPG